MLSDEPLVPTSHGKPWETDAHPSRRLFWLFAGFLLPVGVIAGRLVYLQGVLSYGYFEPHQTRTVTYEWIPERCGRILSFDGRVLAQDAVRYEVHAHYRWVEKPANPLWLRRRALSGLSQTERRESSAVREQEKAVLRERDRMWKRLSQESGRSSAELSERQRTIQRRIERMRDSVEQRLRKRRQQAKNSESQADTDPTRGGRNTSTDDGRTLSGLWRVVVRTLTTPPQRPRREPVVLPEQSDYHRLLKNIPVEVAADIEAHPELYPGLRIRVATRRVYPEHSLAAHVIGHRRRERVSAKDEPAVEELLPHSRADDAATFPTDSETPSLIDPDALPPRSRSIGRSGLEKTYDAVLRGRPGLRKVVRNHRGEVLHTEVIREPQAGQDVVVTLDAALQRRVERLLDDTLSAQWGSGEQPLTANNRQHRDDSTHAHRGAHRSSLPNTDFTAKHGGCIVVLDVHTGAVLSAASAPRFDLNVYHSDDPQQWDTLNNDPRRPFFPRAVRMALAPGSVFKTVSAVALLQDGTINPEAAFHCQGFLDRPDRHRCYIYRHYGVGHGEVNLEDAISRSCNVYFYNAARQMGPRPLVRWARRFGFGAPTGVDLPGEASGNVPSPFDTPDDTGGTSHPWYPGDTLGLAIGQSRLTVTPLQIARMMAAVANGGTLVTPHLLRRLGAASRMPAPSESVKRAGSAGDRNPASVEHRPDDPRRSEPERQRQTSEPESQRRNRRQFQASAQPIPELHESTLHRVRSGLQKVVQHHQGTGYKYVRLTGIAIAGKTGTAEVRGKGDHAWFAGYAPADNPRIAFVVVLEHAGSGGRNAGPVAKQLVQLLLNSGVVHPRVSRRKK